MRAVMRRAAAGYLLLVFAASGSVHAAEKLTLASGQSGTATYAAGVGLSSLIKFELLPSEKIDLQASESGGAVDNVRRLQAHAADLAILPAAIGHAARLGIGSFAGDPPETGLRAIATLWRDALHLVVREGDVSTGTIDDLAALKDSKFLLGDVSSGMADAHQLLLSDLGLDKGDALQVTTVADGDGVSAIKRGDIDVFGATAHPPLAMVENVFATPSSGLRLLDVTEAQMAKVNGNHWLWTPYVIPASTYPGQDEDVWTIAMSSLLVVRADVDDEAVYAITKSIFENLPYLKRVDPILADMSLDTAIAGMTMPLHPGALRYFTETGLVPGATSGNDATPARGAPAREEAEPPLPEGYPDADVAGEWPLGTGGPLLKAPPKDAAAEPRNDARPKVNEPVWKRRATL